MDFQTRKLNLISYLAQVQDESILNKIEDFILKKEKKGRKEDVKPFTIEEFIARIEKSENDFKNGKFQTQSELEKNSDNW